MNEPAKLTQLSCCPCGYGTLTDDLPLGTEYQINRKITTTALYTCGGCHKTTRINIVWAQKRGKSKGGFLPAALFEMNGNTR